MNWEGGLQEQGEREEEKRKEWGSRGGGGKDWEEGTEKGRWLEQVSGGSATALSTQGSSANMNGPQWVTAPPRFRLIKFNSGNL